MLTFLENLSYICFGDSGLKPPCTHQGLLSESRGRRTKRSVALKKTSRRDDRVRLCGKSRWRVAGIGIRPQQGLCFRRSGPAQGHGLLTRNLQRPTEPNI